MRTVDADKLKEEILQALCIKSADNLLPSEKTIYRLINNAPTVFAEPKRKNGHWYKNSTLINCSVCKHCSWSVNAYEDLVKSFNYCPNCGACMTEEGEKE